jgi:hypothetical protein
MAGRAVAEVRQPAVPRVDARIRVDGVLDEPAWREALILELGYEVEPGENVPPPVRTELLMMYDGSALYAAFRAFDPQPERIRAHLWDRDTIGPDDWVCLILDTFNDERWNYGLLVNPLGVQSDFIELRNGASVEWDAIWDSAGAITDFGYVVEIRVPFSSLRFQRAPGPQVWGIDGVRSYPRTVRHHIGLFPRDRATNCYLCQALKVEGFAGATPGRNLELVPTLTAARTDVRDDFPDGHYRQSSEDLEAGLTARWGVTPNLTLAGTLNPDFSQVEADALELDVNQPFALFFEEKRPFFMEGSQYFETLFDVVYTRTMRDPRWGAKLSGREGRHTIGAYVVSDEVTNLLFPSSQRSAATSLDHDSDAAVLRYAHDFGSSFALGGLYTGREGDGYSNHLVGVDGDLQLSASDRFAFQMLRSSTEYPDAIAAEFAQPEGSFSDWAGQAEYSHDGRNLDAWVVYYDVGRDFRADLGFMPRVDYRRLELGSQYTWYPDSGQRWFTSINLEGGYLYVEDHDGGLLDEDWELVFTYQGPLQMHSLAQLNHRREGFGGHEFELDEAHLHHCMKPNGHSHAFVNLWLGDRVDYDNVRLGDRLRLQPGFNYSLGRHFRLDLWHTYERMEIASQRLYTANASALTTAYQFNPHVLLRAIVQWVDYEYTTDLYSDGREPVYERLFTQLLFSYKLNPQTVLFVGYSDSSLGGEGYELTRADRTVFLKVGYAWTL